MGTATSAAPHRPTLTGWHCARRALSFLATVAGYMKLSETLRRPDTNAAPVAPAASAAGSDMRQGLLINAAAGDAKPEACSATRDADPGVARLAPADSASGSGDGARSSGGAEIG